MDVLELMCMVRKIWKQHGIMSGPQNTPQSAFGEVTISTGAGLRLVQNLRQQVESRYRCNLMKLDRFERLVAAVGEAGKENPEKFDRAERLFSEIIRANDESPLMTVSFGVSAPWDQRASLVHMVRAAVETYVDEEFTLTLLCRRMSELFPDNTFSRVTVAKRLHDLRQGADALVATVKLTTPMKEHRYRLRPRSR